MKMFEIHEAIKRLPKGYHHGTVTLTDDVDENIEATINGEKCHYDRHRKEWFNESGQAVQSNSGENKLSSVGASCH